jgi:hypothetical protein
MRSADDRIEPGRGVLGPEVEQQECARRHDGLGDRVEERLAAAVDPVEVLDQDDVRRARDLRADQPAHDRQQTILSRLGVAAAPGGLVLVGDADELEDERQGIVQARIEQEERAGDLPPRLFVAVALVDAEHRTQEREDGHERYRSP